MAFSATALALAACGSFGAGTAAAQDEIRIADCSTTVRGEPGQPIVLEPAAALAGVPVADRLAARMKPVPIGTVTEGGGVISGIAIADALRFDGPLTAGARDAVAAACSVTVETATDMVAPAREGARDVVGQFRSAVLPPGPAPAAPAPAPGAGPGAAPSGDAAAGQAPPAAAPTMPAVAGPVLGPPGVPTAAMFAGLPAYDFGTLLTGSSMFGTVPSAQLFGYSPEFGILGSGQDDAVATDLVAAGRAEALPTTPVDRVALPVLVATLMIAAVSVALVRNFLYRGPQHH